MCGSTEQVKRRDSSSMKDQSAAHRARGAQTFREPGPQTWHCLRGVGWSFSTSIRRTNGDGHTLDGGGRAGEAEESAPGFEHEGEHFLTKVERAVKIDVYARLDVLAREFEEGLHDEGRIGVKEGGAQLVRWPLLLDGGEGVLERLGVGHIACERVGLQQKVPVADGRRSIRGGAEGRSGTMEESVKYLQSARSPLRFNQKPDTLTSPPLLRTSSATPSTVLRVRPRTATAE